MIAGIKGDPLHSKGSQGFSALPMRRDIRDVGQVTIADLNY